MDTAAIAKNKLVFQMTLDHLKHEGYIQIDWRCMPVDLIFSFFFLNDPPPTEISPLPLHDALPIWGRMPHRSPCRAQEPRTSRVQAAPKSRHSGRQAPARCLVLARRLASILQCTMALPPWQAMRTKTGWRDCRNRVYREQKFPIDRKSVV